jgi:ferredoxin
VNPLIVMGNNTLNEILGTLGYAVVYEIPMLNLNFTAVAGAFCMFVIVVFLSYKHGRIFCNLLCPAGAFLGLLSRFSIYKLKIDNDSCIECGLCERLCKAGCINSKTKEIDFAACIGCFNCIDGCSEKSIHYKRRFGKKNDAPKAIDSGRRQVLKSSVLPALGMFLPVAHSESSEGKAESGYRENRKHPISPPGSQSVERFTSLCTACHLCISNCPTQVLYPSFLEYGISGVFQPRMNYDISYCNYDCAYCSAVCPSGAILPLGSSKKEVQIGQVQFVREDCIVVKNGTDCGACSEHCPTQAVNIEICVGCGACEYVCPAEPDKAIYVKSNMIHQKALKPETKKAEQEFDGSQDFPF